MSNDETGPTLKTPPERRRTRARLPAQVYDTIEEAAAKLGLTVQGLRARCRRNAVREGKEIRCHLGDGVVATKFGRTWRVRFPARVGP